MEATVKALPRRGPGQGLTRENVMRVREVADLLGLSVSTVRRWSKGEGLADGQSPLPCRGRGNVRFFLRTEVEAWMLAPDDLG